MNRKEFLQTSCTVCTLGAGALILGMESCEKPDNNVPAAPTVNFTIDLSQSANSALNTPGGSIERNGVVIANTNSGYVALSKTCTHNGCTVAFNSGNQRFVCPCHGGTYDTNGTVVAGPPPSPLKKYNVTQNGNILTIQG